MLLEGAERSGIAIEPILASLGLDRSRFANDAPSVPWSTFTKLCDEVANIVNNEQPRLTEIGLAMTHIPSNAQIHRLGRTIVSPRFLFELVERWHALSNFPHIPMKVRFVGDRVIAEASIPPAYEPCAAFFKIAVGSMAAIPTFVGLPACEVLEARIDERSLYLDLKLPPSKSVLSRGARAISALVSRPDRAKVLEDERQMLQDSLRASQRARNELRTVLERMPALVVIHIDGKIVFANRMLASALGSTPEELLGTTLIDLVHPRSHSLFTQRIKQSTETEFPELTEAWLVAQNGEPVAIEVCPPRVIEFDGATARLVVGRDINERERLQKQLATADRLAALGLLAAGVAHEVNNPLAYLLNNIEIAMKQLKPADAARQALQVALEGAHRIRFIVRELLLLAREDPDPAATADLASAVESTLALAKVEIARTAKLTTEIAPVPLVRGSVPRIAQIVLNLVLNSIEAMRERDPAENELTVRIRRADEEHVVLEIGDNGVGVDAPDAERIFLPFFTTKSAGKGTGLGLAVTQRLVSELGGEISFTSERGRGTTFRVLFPIAPAEALPQTA